jgi:N-methylhydantoinase A
MEVRRAAALHYKGQSFELVVPAPAGAIDKEFLDRLADAFGAEHERVYGHRAGPEEPVELVSIQVVAASGADSGGVPERVVPSRPEPEPGPPRQVFFGQEQGWVETPILRRSDLEGGRAGPLIVEEYDATCVVPPGAKASLDGGGNIVIQLA